MKMHIATIWALACIMAGVAVALIPWLATESYEAYKASALCQTTRFVGLALVFAPVVAVIGYVVLDFCLSLCAMFRRMNRWTWRKWGYAPGIIGVMTCVMSPGPDQEPNTIPMMLGAIAVGIGLMALGWLVNHWPPRAYWPYITGRAVVPPHRHIPYTSSMEVYGE